MTPGIAILLLSGLLLLVFGAEALVRSASRMASHLGVSPLVIGLTVVAFGTGAPEIAVSMQAAWIGSGDIAVGNVIGSNIANILLVLGLTVVISPMLVSRQIVRIEVPLMIVVSVLAYVLALNGRLGRLEGFVLVLGIIGYTLFQILYAKRYATLEVRRELAQSLELEAHAARWSWPFQIIRLLIGLGLLMLGASLLVNGATQLARALGFSELIIGLTVVAVGTSLPELATSLLAAFRGERDIAVGNLVGSNIFNLLAVLGLSALVAPAGLSVSPRALEFDFPVMIAVAVACLPVFYSGMRISRWEGLLFLGYYAAYVLYLMLFSTGRGSAAHFASAMLTYAYPLTALIIVLTTAVAWRRQRKVRH